MRHPAQQANHVCRRSQEDQYGAEREMGEAAGGQAEANHFSGGPQKDCSGTEGTVGEGKKVRVKETDRGG